MPAPTLPVNRSVWPIVGYAGDFSYIGHTRGITTKYLCRIVQAHRKMQIHTERVYALWQLSLWVLFTQSDPRTVQRHNVAILCEHQHAAAPFIDAMLKEEEEFVIEFEEKYSANTGMTTLAGNAYHGAPEVLSRQVTCNKCHVEVWNVFFSALNNTNDDKITCKNCFRRLRTGKATVALRFMFTHPKELREQFQQLCVKRNINF